MYTRDGGSFTARRMRRQVEGCLVRADSSTQRDRRAPGLAISLSGPFVLSQWSLYLQQPSPAPFHALRILCDMDMRPIAVYRFSCLTTYCPVRLELICPRPHDTIFQQHFHDVRSSKRVLHLNWLDIDGDRLEIPVFSRSRWLSLSLSSQSVTI